MAARSLPPARTGQNGCSLGLPSGRTVARNATGKHGAPGGAGWPRPKAVMPGHSIAATAAISGAPDSNSRQVATTPLSRHSRRKAARLSLTHQQRTPAYLIRERPFGAGFHQIAGQVTAARKVVLRIST